jgi:hypothetical protein
MVATARLGGIHLGLSDGQQGSGVTITSATRVPYIFHLKFTLPPKFTPASTVSTYSAVIGQLNADSTQRRFNTACLSVSLISLQGSLNNLCP